MWRSASPQVPGLGHAHHHRTHTTGALAASASERSAQRNSDGTCSAYGLEALGAPRGGNYALQGRAEPHADITTAAFGFFYRFPP
jgi:hypothetical protein